MPKVSIIVPVYKVEPYLHQCVDSVLNQTFTDYELILVDDGSPDNCGAICDEYAAKDSRVSVVHLDNGGQGRARNIAMGMTSGKYTIFLDSDDYWLPQTLEVLFTEAEKNQTQLLVFGFTEFVDGIERQIDYNQGRLIAQNGIVKTGPESLKCALDSREYFPGPVLRLYRTDFLQECGVRFEEGIIHEDVNFCFLTYLYSGRVECIGDRLYQRRLRPNSTMTGKKYRASAHGKLVGTNRLIDIFLLKSHNAHEKELLERYIAIRVRGICGVYGEAVKEDLGAAFAIQREARETLKRARVFQTLSKQERLSTYSLFLGWLLPGMFRKIRRILSNEETAEG